MRRRIVAALIGTMSLAAGCAYDPTVLDAGYTLTYEVPAVRVMQPQGPEFNQGLRGGYLDLASAMGGELADKWHFELKAVDAANGQRVLPDAIESRWLAADRAEELAAARALIARGVPQAALDVPWFSETQPRIPTPDRVREPQNRRVEIMFGDSPSA